MNKQDFISLVPDLRCAAVGAALAILDDCEEAEDVAQETMLRMWENVERLDDDARRAKAFAAVTARNLAQNRLRQKRRWPILRLLSRHDCETSETPLRRMEASDADSAFSQALQQLPIVWKGKSESLGTLYVVNDGGDLYHRLLNAAKHHLDTNPTQCCVLEYTNRHFKLSGIKNTTKYRVNDIAESAFLMADLDKDGKLYILRLDVDGEYWIPRNWKELEKMN